MKRWLTWLLLAAALLGLLGLFAASETALRMVIAAAAQRMSGEFSAQNIRGNLFGPIVVEDLRYQTPDMEVEVKQASLDWRPLALLKRQVHIEHLAIEDVSIRLTKTAEPAPSGAAAPPTGFSAPVNVRVDAAVIDGIQLQQSSGAQQRLDRVRLAARLDDTMLTLDTLEIAAPQGSLTVTGRVDTRDLALDLRTTWRLQWADFKPLEGGGTLAGNATELRIEQTLRSPAEAQLRATLRNLAQSPTWSARLDLPALDLHRARKDWPMLVLAAEVEAHGGFAAPWEIDRLSLALPEDGTRVEAQGRLTLDASLDASLDEKTLGYAFDGRWQDIAWPLQVSPQYKSRSGQFQLAGSGERYRLALEGDVEAPDFPPGRAAMLGDGDQNGLRVEQLALYALDGEIHGRGEIAWRPALRWQADLAAQAVNPGARWPQWPGRLDANFTTSGSSAEAGLDMMWDMRRVQGMLRGYPVDGHVKLEIHDQNYRLHELVWRSAGAELEARGELTDRWQLTWSARATDMASLWPDLRGRLTASGTLSGERHKPRLELRLSAEQAQLKALRADNIRGTLDLDLSEQRPSRIDLDIADARVSELTLDTARLQGVGKLSAHRWLFDVRRGEQRLHLGLQGGYAEPAWQGTLAEAEWTAGKAGTWSLEHPANISLALDAATAANTCLRADLRGETARICASGGWSLTGDSEFHAEFAALPASLAAALLPEGWQWQDAASGHVTAQLKQDLSLLIDGSVKLGPGKVTYIVKDRDPIGLDYERVALGVRTDARGTRLNLTALLGAEDRVDATVHLPMFHTLSRPDLEQPVTGRMTGRYHDLDIVSVFAPALAEPRGVLQWDIHLDGTLDAPRVSGSGTLSQAAAALPELGITLSDVELHLTGAESRRLRWQGSARSGRGALSLNGEWLLDAEAGWPLHATIKGTDVEIVRRPGLWIVATPDLTADVKDRQLTLRGTVRLPQANIEMKGIPETAITPSQDVVIVRRRDEAAAAQGEAGWRVESEIRLLPEDQVNFEGFGLTGRVKGDLRLNQSPGKPFLGTGSLEIVNGQYHAFGIDLDIEQGKLVFANSPLDNPAVDLRAVRVVEESGTVIVAGLRVQGRLKDATLTLYSEPPMAESDILSYLLLGRPADETSGSDADLLIAAATAVGTKQAYVAAKRLAQSLGFEETRITPSGLVLGKSLSSRMYVTYEIGLLAPTNTLQIRYRLSDLWAIKAESSEAESADLIYTIER